MAPPRPPVSSPADYATQLEILRKIERLGGSAGYDANPDAFSDFVPALDPFDSEVWTTAIKELAEHEKDSDARALKAQLQAELDLQHTNPKLAQKQRVSKIIKGIESLGGSVGFQKFTENPQTASPKADGQTVAAASSEWSSCHASGFVASAWFITALTIYANDHTGSGHAWGPAIGVGHLQGVLTYDKFDADGFNFQNAAGAATAAMTLNGTLTSRFVGAVIGVSVSLSFGGGWHW